MMLYDQSVIDATLDELLKSWHRWQSSYRLRTGYPSTAAGCEQYRPSRQYDDQNGALDQDADAEMARTVDAETNKMADPYRTAIHVEAKNLCTFRVWKSARLTDDPVRLRVITVEARGMLWKRLLDAGVI